MMTKWTTMFSAQFFLLVVLLLQVVTPSLGLLRLVGGGSNYGRLELFYNGEWGTVCDDNFGIQDARVACRELGLDTVVTAFYANARYGEGTGTIWLDDVECTGSESSLDSCLHSTYGTSNCQHSEDVSISCGVPNEPTGGPLRLVGGGSNYGRLEVLYNGEWGTVCDDNFGIQDAQVACRELGLDTFMIEFYPGARYGEGTGSIWLDEVECTGSESTLDSCSRNIYGINDCSHAEDVSILCGSITDGESLEANLRLEDGGSNYGRLEIFYNGVWGTVCDDSFDILDARVACRQLGFDTSSIDYYTDARFGAGTGRIWLDQVECSGSEANLNSCDHNSYGENDCTHSEDVGISCGATNIGGTTPSSFSGVGSWIGGAIFIIVICMVAVVFRRRRMHAMRQRQNTRFIQPPTTTTVHVTANPNAPGTTPMPTYHHTPTPQQQPGGYPTQTFTPTYPPASTGGAPPANPYPVQAFPPAAQYPAQPPPGTTPYPPQAGAPYPTPSTAGAPPYPPQSTAGAPPYPPPSAAGAPQYPPPSTASAPPYPPTGSAPYPPQQPVDASAAYPPQGGNVPVEDLPPPPSYDDTVRQ